MKASEEIPRLGLAVCRGVHQQSGMGESMAGGGHKSWQSYIQRPGMFRGVWSLLWLDRGWEWMGWQRWIWSVILEGPIYLAKDVWLYPNGTGTPRRRLHPGVMLSHEHWKSSCDFHHKVGSSSIVYSSTRCPVTKYHRWGDLNNRNIPLTVLDTGSPRW